jgi:hypothetical protein
VHYQVTQRSNIGLQITKYRSPDDEKNEVPPMGVLILSWDDLPFVLNAAGSLYLAHIFQEQAGQANKHLRGEDT